MKMNILKAPDPALHKVCSDVDPGDPRTLGLADALVETMRWANGLGLAAPQVGEAVRMFCMRHRGGVRVLCNPVITRRGREVIDGDEECLSIPGINMLVRRHNIITVEWRNVHGMKFSEKLRGMDARCVQHEIDHLDGILITGGAA